MYKLFDETGRGHAFVGFHPTFSRHGIAQILSALGELIWLDEKSVFPKTKGDGFISPKTRKPPGVAGAAAGAAGSHAHRGG